MPKLTGLSRSESQPCIIRWAVAGLSLFGCVGCEIVLQENEMLGMRFLIYFKTTRHGRSMSRGILR